MCHNPMQCIVPPHMLENIRLKGSDDQRKMVEEIAEAAVQARTDRSTTNAEQARSAVLAMFQQTPGKAPASLAAATRIAGPLRRVYDAKNRAKLPGQLAREEGDPPTNEAAVDGAYDAAGDTYHLYKDAYGRNSLDGHGLPLVLSVHYRRNHNNAYWDGTQMLFGDGDDELFVKGGFTKSLSVVAHELTHGVVQFCGGLRYSGQSGALNEHIADVFGVLALQKKLGQGAHEADWLVGAEIVFDAGGNHMPLRSMKAPGTAYDHPVLGLDPQPFHMRGYVHTSDDNGGVHINSGIPNHAFYLYAMLLGGNAWERAGHVWYDALQGLNDPYLTFTGWADRTVRAAAARFGAGRDEELFARRAWQLVGVL